MTSYDYRIIDGDEDGGKYHFASIFVTFPDWLYTGGEDHVDLEFLAGRRLGSAFNNNVEWTANVASVPVPAALWFMGSGLFGLMRYAKTRRSQF